MDVGGRIRRRQAWTVLILISSKSLPAAMPSSRLAKLSPPRASNWLARRRLNRLIDQATKNGVAWIAAEPGAGKSTLAAAWSSSRTGRLLWYRVDEGEGRAQLQPLPQVHAAKRAARG